MRPTAEAGAGDFARISSGTASVAPLITLPAMGPQPWEYQIISLRTENDASGAGWIALAHETLVVMGEEGWKAGAVLKQEPGYTHVLFRRPKAAEPAETEPVFERFLG